MEALKIIPQVFFDIIARVVPGCTAIVAWLLLLQKTWELTMSGLFGTSFAEDSTTLSFLIFLGAGYVVGELISPLAKGMQRINKNIPFSLKEYKELKSRRDKKREEEEQEKRAPQKVKVLSGTEHANASKKTFSEEDLSYDRLRLQHPEVGALCAKIRAEFTMHNALAVVFGFSAVGYPFSPLPFHWLVFIVLVTLTWLTAYRGKSTNKTFNETKAKFDLLIKEQKASAKNAIPEIPSGTALANESSALFQ